MIDMYKSVNAELVTSKKIILNFTERRLYYYDLIFLFTFGFFLFINILSYKSQDLSEIILTIGLIIFFSIINLSKKKIFHKSIIFEREKQTITFRRTIPYLNKKFDYSNIKLKTNVTHYIDEGRTYVYRHLWIQQKFSDKKYKVYKTSPNIRFDVFLEKYMNSDYVTVQKLVYYKKPKNLNSYFN
ncbi:protein of unknown function [Tenacibaculum jejuense]|uniref:Uncharacterized protein n=1 Tax=Tenacibaculum jejuense TaxID=584609 RepID=A0A238U5H4_9FLAO|nr:protein of unknown function [Tenacibaculum jejuense]